MCELSTPIGDGKSNVGPVCDISTPIGDGKSNVGPVCASLRYFLFNYYIIEPSNRNDLEPEQTQGSQDKKNFIKANILGQKRLGDQRNKGISMRKIYLAFVCRTEDVN